MTAAQVTPQHLLPSGWLLTNVQANITTMLHDTGYTCIYITLVLLFIFFFLISSIFLGRLAVLHSFCPLQVQWLLYLDLTNQCKNWAELFIGLLDAGWIRSMKHNLTSPKEALKMLFTPNVASRMLTDPRVTEWEKYRWSIGKRNIFFISPHKRY
jgi:hypothetical protein